MAGAGARSRKSGAPSARVGSVEVLRPRQIGPTIPSMRALKGDYAAAAGAKGAERRTLEAKAESGRLARAALLTARGGERRALAAAEAGAPHIQTANVLGTTAEHHYEQITRQRAEWHVERMRTSDPLKRARLTGVIKQYDAAIPAAHAAMMKEGAEKAARAKPGLETLGARMKAATVTPQKGATPATLLAQVKAMPAGKPAAERGESPRRLAREQAKTIREANATLAAGKPVLAAAQAARAEHAAAGAAVKALRSDAPLVEKKAVLARWDAAKAGLAEQGKRMDAALGKPRARVNSTLPEHPALSAHRAARAEHESARAAADAFAREVVKAKRGGAATLSPEMTARYVAVRDRLAAAAANRDATAQAVYSALSKPARPARPAAARVAKGGNVEIDTATGKKTVPSIASAAGIHVVASPVYRGESLLIDAKSGRSIGASMPKAQALAMLNGMASGKTTGRLLGSERAPSVRAQKALARYRKIVEAREVPKAAKGGTVDAATASKARALGATSVRGGKVAFHPNAWERHNDFKAHLEKTGVPFRVKHTGTFVLG